MFKDGVFTTHPPPTLIMNQNQRLDAQRLNAQRLKENESHSAGQAAIPLSNVQPQEPSVTSSERAEIATWKRMWSVQTVIALLCLVCILLTASATEVMNTVTCDSALEDTRDTMDRSTRKLSTVASSSLERVSTDMMTYITNGVLRLIEKHMRGALEEAARVNDLLESEFRYMPKNDTEWLAALSQRLLYLVNTTDKRSAVTAYSIFGGDWGIGMSQSNEINEDMPSLSLSEATTFYFSPTERYVASAAPVTGLVLDETKKSNIVITADALEFSMVTRNFVALNAPPVFPVIGPVSDAIGYALMSKRTDHSGSIPEGMETGVFVALGEIERFLQQVTQSAIEQNPDAIMRAYTTVASTWFANNGGGPAYEQTGHLTGASAGKSTTSYYGMDPMYGMNRSMFRSYPAVEATDPYIRAIAIKIDGNYSKYHAEGSQTIFINVTGHNEEHFVSVKRLTFPENGLDWWLTVTIDADSILGKVQRSSTVVHAEIAEDKQEVADEVEEKKMLQRGIIIGIGALLVVLSAVTSWALLRPVKAMQRSMELVANMELDEIEISKSTFYELRLMQRDFRKMIDNLVEFRAYVPSSVLESSGYSGEGGQTVVAPPTGHVAIVFTDIRGSTALWKCSAEHMNVAMEIHNDVMRDACVAHKGYEVKTIGDSFMVSFSSAVAAANFALDVQTNLASQKWPSGLDLPEAGLVVRIGINYGATIAEQNPVTGRVDYRGSTVNLASRVEAKALPGTVCITTDMYAALKGNLDKVGNPKVSRFGTHEIKGLGNGYELFLMVPTALDCRLNPAQSDCVVVVQAQSDAEDGTDGGHTIKTGSSSLRNLASGGAKKTALHLQKTGVTVAVCRLKNVKDSLIHGNCNIMVRAAHEAAQSTDGVIGNVTGCTLTVVWNASKRCLMHTTAALTFVSEMKKLQDSIQVGLATGTMLHGNVGTRTSRFATAFGAPLEAAEAMTDHAHRLGVYCLHADCTSDKRLQADQTLRSCLRLVDAWRDVQRDMIVSIYEVHAAALEEALHVWTMTSGGASAHPDIELHTALVQAALRDTSGIPALREAAHNAPRDEVLQKVLSMIASTTPKDGYRAAVRFTHYAEVDDV